MSLSKVVLSGRVVRQPEKRFTANTNVPVTEFAIQVDIPARQDMPSEPQFVKVITWRDLAERCAQELKKGDLVAVDGRLQINTYTASDGQKKREPEIEASFVENLSQAVNKGSSLSDEPEAREKVAAPAGTAKEKKANEDFDSIFASEDEIPF